MSFKEKVKNFGKVILSIPIGIILSIPIGIITVIPFIISLPMIPMVYIFDLISKFLVKFRQEKESTGEEKEFTASKALEEALERLQADSLPDYQVLKDNEQSNVPDLTSGEKKRIARFGYSKDPNIQELIKTHQDKDEVTKKFLLGCIKLGDNASVKGLRNALRARKEEAKEKSKEESKEGSVVSNVVRQIVRQITIMPKVFLFLFLGTLEAIGLSHVKLPKSKTYQKELSSFNSRASILSNSRSTMEKKVAQSLRRIVVDNITSYMTSLSADDNVVFFGLCREIIVKPNHNEYEKVNNEIVEKIAGIFRLLTNVKLGIRPSDNEEFKKEFDHEVCNLLKCACSGYLNVYPFEMSDEAIISSLDGQELRTSFSNFLDNLLQSKAISGLSKADQANYIDILCTKMLKACIVYGSVYGSNCPAPSLPLSYSKHVDNIATHLSNDIIKTFSLDELGTLYNMSSSDLERCINNNFLLKKFFSKECIKTELSQPVAEIRSIIDALKDKLEPNILPPDGIKSDTEEEEPQPTPSLSETISSQDSAHVNNGQQV